MDFSNFFSNFTTPDSIALLILWVLAFLFGILLGSALRGGTIRRLRRDLEIKQNELTASQGEVARLTDELHLREADLRKSQFEVEEQRSKAERVTDEKTKLYNEIYSLTTQLEKLQKEPGSAAPVVAELNTTIERLNADIYELQNKNKALEDELEQLRNAPAEPAPALPEPAEDQSFDYIADFQSTQNALRARLEVMEEKLNRLVTENDELRNEMQTIKTTAPQPEMMERTLLSAAPMVAEEPDWNLGNNEPPRQSFIPTDEIQRDDLTRIDGIGPFLERQLNDQGIFTYEQIARWDGSDIHQVTQQIRYFPGRIERENWVGQAVQLYQQKQNPTSGEPDAFDHNAASAYPSDHQDLKIVEGIGPKIESILKTAGVQSWEDLAEADPEHLKNILEEAGDDYRLHNPATWAAQARLAAGGHWELLREYQEQLKGGRELH